MLQLSVMEPPPVPGVVSNQVPTDVLFQLLWTAMCQSGPRTDVAPYLGVMIPLVEAFSGLVLRYRWNQLEPLLRAGHDPATDSVFAGRRLAVEAMESAFTMVSIVVDDPLAPGQAWDVRLWRKERAADSRYGIEAQPDTRMPDANACADGLATAGIREAANMIRMLGGARASQQGMRQLRVGSFLDELFDRDSSRRLPAAGRWMMDYLAELLRDGQPPLMEWMEAILPGRRPDPEKAQMFRSLVQPFMADLLALFPPGQAFKILAALFQVPFLARACRETYPVTAPALILPAPGSRSARQTTGPWEMQFMPIGRT